MITFLLVLSLSNFCFGAKKLCVSRHTGFFYENYNNSNALFFIRETFAPDGSNRCHHITNDYYRNVLYSNINKQGIDTEHIIDLKNSEPELDDCDKEILGNMILANRSWNRAVGSLCWEYVKAEKLQVYGDIFNEAMRNVRECCGLTSKPASRQSAQPTRLTPRPSVPQPTFRPSFRPTPHPTSQHSFKPTSQPTNPFITRIPTPNPTYRPTPSPTGKPSNYPTREYPINTLPTSNPWQRSYQEENQRTFFIAIGCLSGFLILISLGMLIYHFRNPEVQSHDTLDENL